MRLNAGVALFLLPLSLPLLAACGHTPVSTDPGPNVPVIEHVRTQEVLTPLPLRVSLPRKMGAEHVVVLFKPWGVRGWKQVELPRRADSQTWSGEVSCREVSTVTGDTKYFFLALDDSGEVVGGSGSPNWPHLATIVGKMEEGAQSLVGQGPPVRCHDVADCPPDFPGCPAYKVQRKECSSTRDCGEGEACAWDGYCGAPSANPDPTAVENLSDEQQLEIAIRTVRQRYRTAKN